MTIKTLLRVWAAYIAISWITSIAMFYNGIGLGGDLHRWLPVIAKAEDFFTAQGQLDFLKQTAVIYEKDLALLALMLIYMLVVIRYSMNMKPSGFFKLSNYKGNYLGLLAIVVFLTLLVNCILGPNPGDATGFRPRNLIYRFDVFFGVFHYTLILPLLAPVAGAAVGGFLETVRPRVDG